MQEELAVIKAIACLQVSPAVLREVRSAVVSGKKKKTAVAAVWGSTAHGIWLTASRQLAGKRKANELLSSSD
jgi:hypothetical protein